jgi:hypothetical protein
LGGSKAITIIGDAAKKREYVTRAVKIFEGAYGPGHPHTKYYQNVLAKM